MAQQSDLATMFLLAGEDLKISYYINEDHSSELDYQDAQGSLTFQSNQLHIQKSAIGTLITATLKSSADVGATTFTLVLPNVKLGGQTKQPLTVSMWKASIEKGKIYVTEDAPIRARSRDIKFSSKATSLASSL